MGVRFFLDIRLVAFLVAQLCVAAALSADKPLSPTCLNASSEAANLIGVSTEGTSAVGVDESAIKFDSTKPIGEGSFHKAYDTEFNGQPAVFVKSKTTSDISDLSAVQKQELAGMSLKEAEEILRSSSKASTTFEKARRQVASDLADVSYNTKLQGLTANGRPIAAKIQTVVRDSNGVPIGYVMEKVSGTNMGDLALSQKLKISDIISIRDQVVEQIKVLNANGLQHGDLLMKNIMVDMSSGKPVARIIDFNFEHVLYQQKINSHSRNPVPIKSDMKTWLQTVYESIRITQKTDRLEDRFPDLHSEFFPQNHPLWSSGGRP